MVNHSDPQSVWSALRALDDRRRAGDNRSMLMDAAQEAGLLHTEPAACSAVPAALFLPVILGEADDATHVVAQLGTSLDGRIATESGNSHYVTGPENIDHLHRLRALADAVVVGAETVLQDDPRLTVRRVEGPNPLKVVLDPRGRVGATSTVIAEGGPVLILTAMGIIHPLATLRPDIVRVLGGDDMDGQGRFLPHAVVRMLQDLGHRRLFVEGGGRLVSAFLQAGCLDRLHVCVAPMIIGSGRPAFVLPPVETLAEAIQAKAAIYRQGADVLFDLDLTPRRSDRDDRP